MKNVKIIYLIINKNKINMSKTIYLTIQFHFENEMMVIKMYMDILLKIINLYWYTEIH